MIVDDVIICLIERGLLNLGEILSLLKFMTHIYEELADREETIQKQDKALFRERAYIYTLRREKLGNILLHILMLLHDIKILIEEEEEVTKQKQKIESEEGKAS